MSNERKAVSTLRREQPGTGRKSREMSQGGHAQAIRKPKAAFGGHRNMQASAPLLGKPPK